MRRLILVAAALVPLAMVVLPGPAQAAVRTTLSLTFTEADGVTPVANATVGVFYMQPADSDKPVGTTVHLAELGSGTTSSSGVFSTALNTSAVAGSDLGDAGDGKADAFNVTVIAVDQAGNQALVDEIVKMNSAFTGSARIKLQSSSTPGTAHPAALLPARVPILAKRFRYTPVTPLNSGAGMQAVLRYTTSASIRKETDVNTAVISTAPGGGGWSVGDMQLEEKDRDVTAPYKVNGSFHRWMWARYKYVEYAFRLDHEWKANHFTGDLTVKNPDRKKGSKKAIGVVKYKVPGFTPGPQGAYWFALTQARSGWTRSFGTRKENDASATFFIPFGGSLVLKDLTTYAAVTSVTYNHIRGCVRGHTRVIWGDGDDPVDIPRVEANCLANSGL